MRVSAGNICLMPQFFLIKIKDRNITYQHASQERKGEEE